MPTPAIKPLYENVLYVNEKKSLYIKTPFQSAGDRKYIAPLKNDKSLHSVEGVLQNTYQSILSPSHLIEIEERINSSRQILDYKYNWDDNGAIPVNPLIFDRATNFLRDYADSIFNICNKVLRTPDINPVNDGSVDLEWNFENSYFLINFKNTPEEIAFYYGEFKEDNAVIFDANGQINTNSVQGKFATYLSYLSN
jgi:hypothetical protein